MSEVQCPVCDFTLSLEPGEEYRTSLLGAMGAMPSGLSQADLAQVEQQMFEHLEEHTSLEWVTAMRMADLYIARVEDDAHALANHVSALRDQLDRAETSLADLRRRPVQAVQTANSFGAGYPPTEDFGPAWEALSPRERQEQLAADRKAGVIRAIPESLIPFIAPDKRPEGVVGRRR